MVVRTTPNDPIATLISRSDKSGDSRRGFLYFRVRLRTAGVDGVGDAVSDVILQQAERHRLQRAGGRGDLGEDVDAVSVVLDHPLQPADLPLDPAQPGQVRLLVSAVAVHTSTIPATGITERSSA